VVCLVKKLWRRWSLGKQGKQEKELSLSLSLSLSLLVASLLEAAGSKEEEEGVK